MTQKDKVKELVGRGLHSYHTKALQQMDRIEKKNKEQNHKISILTNELDNDYLTKTEEGSVISLEHSKEGMVYLDELQGNTLVNYCTDGSKEMTLNGDIDVEGTFVTTTEGVDNGLVDVMCEGNTLVNLIKYDTGHYYPTYTWEIGEVYTMIVEFTSSAECQLYIEEDVTWAKLAPITNGVKVGYNKFVVKLTIPSNYTGLERINITNRVNNLYDSNVKFTDIKPIVLKGDWTNKEIPQSYFEGMKSVGQDDENGHKIEILSQNKNLVVNSNVVYTFENYDDTSRKSTNTTINFTSNFKNIIRNKKIILGVKAKGENLRRLEGVPQINGYFHYGFDINVKYADGTSQWLSLTKGTLPSGTFEETYYTREFVIPDKEILEYSTNQLFCRSTYGKLILSEPMVMIVDDNTMQKNFVPHSLNKKEILLNEPLRGIDNLKDKLVKISGKWYIERNCGTDTFDGSDDENWTIGNANGIENHFKTNIIKDSKQTTNIPLKCDKVNVTTHNVLDAGSGYGINLSYYLRINLSNCDVKNGATVDDLKQYLQQNPITIVYQLATPIYEPLEIEPTLNAYNDITHISNNSIIPCNMKIQNTGYNAIIKPSTLYTIALDTNKNGTIGMNLGGAKVTTTNNVATITTPATLSDDSLRLYGKGIKGSKVRLLEGDKTNWIPSHFEGMKSSFEDKLQEDGSYKMEILSNNKNLFDIDAKRYYAGWGEHNYQKYNNGFSFNAKNGWNSVGYKFESCKNKMVTVCATVTCINKDDSKLLQQHFRIIPTEHSNSNPSVAFNDGETKKVTFNITLNDGARVYFIGTSNNEGSHKGGIQWFLEDISVVEGIENDYVPRECNKIQFSSIEPLRGVDNIKDKFIFKDGKLMIERNCSKYTTVGTENWLRHDYSNSNKIFAYALVTSMNDRKAYTNIYCNNFATYLKSAEELKNQNNEYIWKGNDAHSALWLWISNNKFDGVSDINKFKTWIKNNPITVTYQLAEPTYEEIPFELQKIILEGYENGTLFFDTNIPPTSTVTYSGETPIVKSVKLNKTEVLNNTNDINDNIVPYLMDMDYRVVCLQLQSENINDGVSMARLFGGTYEMLQRDILSKRYSVEEYKYRLDAYLSVNKITEKEYEELGEMLNE